MNRTPRAVNSLHRRITAILYLRELLACIAVWCVLWGVGGLVARFAFQVKPALLLWGLAGLPIAATIAILRARRTRPTSDAVVALLDREADCGGLLMASTSIPLGEWSVDVQEASIPRVEWKGRRQAALAALSAAFAAAVVLIPARAAQTSQSMEIARDVERLQSRVDLLREEEVLADARAEVMTKTLEALKQEATGEDAAKAWETLDSVAEATSQAAKEAGDESVRKTEQLTRVEAMAVALEGDALDSSRVAEGMRELESEVRAAEGESKDLLSDLPPEVREALAKHALTKEQMKQIAQAAQGGKEKLRQTLSKLRDAGLIDPKTLRQLEDAAKLGNRDDLARFLKENANRGTFGTAIGQWVQGRPGRDRGRGDAPMFFGEQTKDGGKFSEQTLPTAAAAALQQSQLVSVSAAAPDQTDSQRSAGGALTNAQAGGGSAVAPVVLPRHRGTVRRFFERKQNE